MEEKLRLYLNALITNGGSDLHIKSGAIARVRIEGVLRLIGKEVLSDEIVEGIVTEITTQEQYEKLKRDKNIDFTYLLDKDNRFRINIFYQMEGLSLALRLIPVKIPTLDELNLPKVLHDFTNINRGLVLITGVTGSGKSSTLAALIDKINSEKNKHIITIEDPIEFIHKDKGCLINQRSIGQDAHSFSDALKAALREDPDIIVLGELRDLETIDIALHAANTGHLVFSTIHTLDAKETVDRIVGMFSKSEQNRVRTSLASVLEGIISQRLVPTVNSKRIAAVEILKKTARIEELIIENRDYEIHDALFDGKENYGTQTFDQSLLDLLKNGLISKETTLEFATNASDIRLKMEGIGKNALLNNSNGEVRVDVIGFKDDEENKEKR